MLIQPILVIVSVHDTGLFQGNVLSAKLYIIYNNPLIIMIYSVCRYTKIKTFIDDMTVMSYVPYKDVHKITIDELQNDQQLALDTICKFYKENNLKVNKSKLKKITIHSQENKRYKPKQLQLK